MKTLGLVTTILTISVCSHLSLAQDHSPTDTGAAAAYEGIEWLVPGELNVAVSVRNHRTATRVGALPHINHAYRRNREGGVDLVIQLEHPEKYEDTDASTRTPEENPELVLPLGNPPAEEVTALDTFMWKEGQNLLIEYRLLGPREKSREEEGLCRQVDHEFDSGTEALQCTVPYTSRLHGKIKRILEDFSENDDPEVVRALCRVLGLDMMYELDQFKRENDLPMGLYGEYMFLPPSQTGRSVGRFL